VKKVIPILLTCLILLNSIGYIFIYIERLANNKLEIRAIIKSNRDLSILSTLKFTRKQFNHELNWKEENEFEYNGEMYDVASIEFSDDDVIIYCIRDEVEEQLISSYEKVFGGNLEKDKFTPPPHTSLFNLHLIAIQNELFSLDKMTDAIPLTEIYNNLYKSIHRQSPSPPPKLS
jgi:hypothetical protein